MKKFLVALIASLVLLLGTPPAQADEGCILSIQGTVGLVVCGGEVVETLPLPTVKVQGPTVTLPPVTEIIPGPVKTIIVPGPTSTTTVRVPSGSQTVTVPGPTSTATVTGPVVTRTPQAVPTQTVTSTATETVTSKSTEEVDKPDDDNVLFDPPPISAPAAVGIGVLALLGLCSLIILALWLGYILGYKDSERKEMKFLDALRDQFYTGKHS